MKYLKKNEHLRFFPFNTLQRNIKKSFIRSVKKSIKKGNKIHNRFTQVTKSFHKEKYESVRNNSNPKYTLAINYRTKESKMKKSNIQFPLKSKIHTTQKLKDFKVKSITKTNIENLDFLLHSSKKIKKEKNNPKEILNLLKTMKGYNNVITEDLKDKMINYNERLEKNKDYNKWYIH